ncbi:Autophagy protein 7 [Coemansia sp. RSA 552]|nr:Autophagy protein 7 [Coemansia sp. RSA 552]
MPELLTFEPLASAVDPQFWAKLAHHKLHSAQLDTARTPIRGEFAAGRRHVPRNNPGAPAQTFAVPARLRVSDAAWEEDQADQAAGSSLAMVSVAGYLLNTNTVEEFKRQEKAALLRSTGAEILEAVRSGQATQNPALLWPFVLLSFADLKKYRFYHWFAFPAVMADPPDAVVAPVAPVAHPKDLHTAFAAFARTHTHANGAFVARHCKDSPEQPWELFPLTEWSQVFESRPGEGQPMLGFVDPSSHATRPGWPLRNLLTWLRHTHPEVDRIKILCLRDQDESMTVDVAVTPAASLSDDCQVGGWERNERERLAPRVADLSATMDPGRLASSALDLNLQLMRWRLAPNIDLARMAGLRALLVGAGTLGAYAARGLLAWGVRKITFVDNGHVSFSNPPRQPLYEFEDCLAGGKPKAAAAAASLRRIFPGVDAQGVQLAIPMPGHTVAAAEVDVTHRAVDRLDSLVADHDVVFLLTDSRESRWLPTLLGALHGKIVLCVALGFDSFVAMRHGAGAVGDAAGSGNPDRLGCYFCNDVVAPTDSLSDRTLDQQCTVTRPGLAPIAAGTAVELLSTLVQHPQGVCAPAPPPPSTNGDSDVGEDDSSVFGLPPHQIRGYLAGFRQHSIVGQASHMCTACSPAVLAAYRTHGFDFLLRAFNNTPVREDAPHSAVDAADVPPGYSYLETLTGLAALQRQTDRMLDDIEWSGSDNDDFEAV